MIPVIAFKLFVGTSLLAATSFCGVAYMRPDWFGLPHQMYIYGINESAESDNAEADEIQLTDIKNYKCRWSGKTGDDKKFDCTIRYNKISHIKK